MSARAPRPARGSTLKTPEGRGGTAEELSIRAQRETMRRPRSRSPRVRCQHFALQQRTRWDDATAGSGVSGRGTVAAYSPRAAGETPIKLARDPHETREAQRSWSSHFGGALGRITVKFVGGRQSPWSRVTSEREPRDRAEASREGPTNA